jgi:hypothetical protein
MKSRQPCVDVDRHCAIFVDYQRCSKVLVLGDTRNDGNRQFEFYVPVRPIGF